MERVITAAVLLVIVVGAVLLYCITLKYHRKKQEANFPAGTLIQVLEFLK